MVFCGHMHVREDKTKLEEILTFTFSSELGKIMIRYDFLWVR